MTRLQAVTQDGETYIIEPDGNEFIVSLERDYRYNGTQKYDGRFPRHCKSLRGAKTCVTKWLGFKPIWKAF